MLSFLDKALRTLMWIGAPLVFALVVALEPLGVELPKEVSGMLCLLLGVFTVVCIFVGAWTLIT